MLHSCPDADTRRSAASEKVSIATGSARSLIAIQGSSCGHASVAGADEEDAAWEREGPRTRRNRHDQIPRPKSAPVTATNHLRGSTPPTAAPAGHGRTRPPSKRASATQTDSTKQRPGPTSSRALLRNGSATVEARVGRRHEMPGSVFQSGSAIEIRARCCFDRTPVSSLYESDNRRDVRRD